METAKVDIQKLQLLNDRIAQCFDALNQVRLSVHGLSHSTAQGGAGIGQQGFGPQMGAQGIMGAQNLYQQSPYQQNPYLAQGIGQSPFTQGAVPTPWANPLAGLSHTSLGMQTPYAAYGQQQQPFGQVPFNAGQVPFNVGQVPFGIGQTPFSVSPLGNVPPFVSPYAGPGLSHTSPVGYDPYARPLWADPILAAKVAQTFPFVQLPISPVGI